MSKPRYDWWSYAKGMIRRYPKLKEQYAELHNMKITPTISGMPRDFGASRTTEAIAIKELPSTSQREYEAVRRAISATERYNNGRDRLLIVNLVFWSRTHTLEGAALQVPCSKRTAERYHGEFIRLVASYYGLLD